MTKKMKYSAYVILFLSLLVGFGISQSLAGEAGKLFDDFRIPFSVSPHSAQTEQAEEENWRDEFIGRPMFSADVDYFLGQTTRTRGAGGRVWGNLYYSYSTLKPKNERFKIKPEDYGAQLGFDLVRAHGVYMVFFYNFNQSNTKYDDWLRSKIQNHMLGLGYFIHLGGCHFGGAWSIGYDDYRAKNRKVVDENYKGNGLQTNIFGEFGVDLIFDQWGFKPFYAMQYDFLYHGRIGEPGMVLKGDWNGHSLVQMFGMRVNWRALENLEFQLRTTWVHEMLNHPPPFYHLRFSAVQGTQTPAIYYFNGNIGRDWAWLGLGMKFEMVYNALLYLDYDLAINGRQISHLANLGLCFGW